MLFGVLQISTWKEVVMAKRAYSAPVVRTEAVEIGVFGSYGSSGSSGGGISRRAAGGKKGGWLWWLFPWNW
jgi:hypothetical protein